MENALTSSSYLCIVWLPVPSHLEQLTGVDDSRMNLKMDGKTTVNTSVAELSGEKGWPHPPKTQRKSSTEKNKHERE